MTARNAAGKIKILRIIARLNIGGPAIHVVNLTSGLDPSRFEQLLVAGAENPGEGSMLDYALSLGVQPVIIPEMVNELSLGSRDVRALSRLYRLMQQERPHIVHTHTARAGLLGRLAARLAGVPVVIHTYHGHVLRGYFNPVTTWLMAAMERTLARMTDQIITVSEQVKRELVSYAVAPAVKMAVIPLGLDLQPFLDCQRDRGKLRRELGVGDKARLVSIVGRIVPIKNHQLFLNAAALIARREPSAHFLIVGDGILRSKIEHYAYELGIADRVIFTGWRRDLAGIYADLDVLVVSSKNEGTPVAAIEAMAAARPVVATRVGGLPDLITEGETGFLVSPGNADELADAVLRLLREPGTACWVGSSARAEVRQRFTVQRLIRDMENLYDALLAQKAPSPTPPPKPGTQSRLGCRRS